MFDWTAFFDWARFTWNAFARHRPLGIGFFVACLLASALAAAFLPRRYASSTRLLVRPVGYMASLAERAPWDETPTRAARERVLAKDSVAKIVADTGLVTHWQLSRNPLLKMKDQLQQLIGGAWTQDVWADIVAGTLEKRLQVSSNDEIVEISVEWPDADMARRIVETASQNFVETRHVTEIAAISEAIGILELHASNTKEEIDAALENLRRVVRERSRGDTRVLRAAANAQPRARPVTSQELAQVKFALRAKQRAVAELEEQKRRAITEARATLDQQYVIYNRTHPAITELERKLHALERDSPQLAQLKRDVAELERIVESKGGKVDAAPGVTPAQPQATGLVNEGSLASLPPELERDPAVSVAQEQVRVALGRYQELLLRVEQAHLALDSARAAFKYRFEAVRPPQTPKTPLSPNVPVLLIAGFLFGLVGMFFACAAWDVMTRAVCEPWQIERQLGLPVLVNMKEAR